MKINEILFESRNKKIILVDFQPAYENATPKYSTAIENVVTFLNRFEPTNILVFYNGDEVGIEDTANEVFYHYVENGLEEEVGNNFNFREKGYAFFRSWMDSGIEPGLIIKVIRHLTITRNNDSREIPEEELIQLIGEHDYNKYIDTIQSDPIYLPDIDIAELKSFSGAYLGGGGKHECLREIQILMSAFNIKYKAVQDWIY